MNKIMRLYRLLSDLSGGRWGIVLISTVLPILIMMGFGLALAIKYGYIVELSFSIVISTLVVTIPLYTLSFLAKKSQVITVDVELEDGLIEASSDWSAMETDIWEYSKAHVRKLLQENGEWSSLDKAGGEVLEHIADKFGKKSLDFSIPEGLKLFEEVSRRYNIVVKENIPGIDYLKLSYIKGGYEAYDKYGELGQKIVKAAVWANHAKNLYFNPLIAVSDLSKQQVTSSMTKGMLDDMQLKAKEALLDEVAAVAIDLYSGRFSLEKEDIQVSNASISDEQRSAIPLEPIRIVAVGQTNAGKSSIINVLNEELVAEVDILPSTDTSTVYSARVNDIEVRVVDVQGLDGNKQTESQMLEEMVQADLILWALKANQSSRDLDKQLKDKFELFYADVKNISRKKPTVISIVNQVDKLKPASDWRPPYNLDNPETAKARVIAQAVSYNQKLFNFDIVLPLSISTDKQHYGVELLKRTLTQQIGEANNVQRNRQRVEAIDRGVSLKKQLGRAINASKKVAPNALRLATPKLKELAIKRMFKNIR